MPVQTKVSMGDQLKIAVAAALVVSGFILFRQTGNGMDLIAIILGLIYIYIRWHRYKRDRYRARTKR